MAANRYVNYFHIFQKKQYLFSSNGIKCLLVRHVAKAPISTEIKNSDPVASSTSVNNVSISDSTNQSSGSSFSQNQKEEEEHKEYEDNIRIKILDASLPFVHNYGWSISALSAGAESLGYPGVTHGLFPRGGAELVQHFYVSCNQQIVEKLKTKFESTTQNDGSSNAAAANKNPKEPKVIISYAVENRLRMIEPYLSHWPQALAIMTLPPNVPTSLANLLTLVDDIWYYAGDRSVDFNWYTRRVALAGIYKMTELYMMQDGSEDHNETWVFLNRRIDEATQLHSLFVQSESAALFAKDIASSTFITARNMLGLNWNR